MPWLESDFHDLVAAWLRDAFADIEHEVTLPSGLLCLDCADRH